MKIKKYKEILDDSEIWRTGDEYFKLNGSMPQYETANWCAGTTIKRNIGSDNILGKTIRVRRPIVKLRIG